MVGFSVLHFKLLHAKVAFLCILKLPSAVYPLVFSFLKSQWHNHLGQSSGNLNVRELSFKSSRDHFNFQISFFKKVFFSIFLLLIFCLFLCVCELCCNLCHKLG